MSDTIDIFYSGSQYYDWVASNCERCTKYNLDFPTCKIDEALSAASMDDGSVTPEIAKRAGYDEDSDNYVWRCGEVEWAEAWKKEMLAGKS